MNMKINLKKNTKKSPSKNTKKNIKIMKLNKFGVFLLAYAGILVSIVILLLVLLYGVLKDYEKSMPNNTMSTLVKDFTPDNIEQILTDNSVKVNEFETVSSIADYFKLKMQDNEVTYKRKTGEFTNETPVYLIKAGDATIAKVTLVEDGKNAHKFTKWKLGSISFDGFIDAANEITITAPSTAEVKLNGVKISDSYVIKKDIILPIVKYVDAYIKTPTSVMYKVSGLMAQPKITSTLNGIDLAVTVDGKACNVNYPTDAALFETQKSNINALNEAFGKYLINRGTLDTLNKFLVGNAKSKMSNIEATWAFLYGLTYTYEFRNQTFTNMVKYSDNCFSCETSYQLYVKWGSGEKTYDTSMTDTFVKINGSWYLADFSFN